MQLNCFHCFLKQWGEACDCDWRCIWWVNLNLSTVIQAVYSRCPSSLGLRSGVASAQLKVIISSRRESFSPLESSGARYWIKPTLQPVTASAQPLLTHRQESRERAGYSRIEERDGPVRCAVGRSGSVADLPHHIKTTGRQKEGLAWGQTGLTDNFTSGQIGWKDYGWQLLGCLCTRLELQQQIQVGVNVVSCSQTVDNRYKVSSTIHRVNMETRQAANTNKNGFGEQIKNMLHTSGQWNCTKKRLQYNRTLVDVNNTNHSFQSHTNTLLKTLMIRPI